MPLARLRTPTLAQPVAEPDSFPVPSQWAGTGPGRVVPDSRSIHGVPDHYLAGDALKDLDALAAVTDETLDQAARVIAYIVE